MCSVIIRILNGLYTEGDNFFCSTPSRAANDMENVNETANSSNKIRISSSYEYILKIVYVAKLFKVSLFEDPWLHRGERAQTMSL